MAAKDGCTCILPQVLQHLKRAVTKKTGNQTIFFSFKLLLLFFNWDIVALQFCWFLLYNKVNQL